MSKVFYGRLTPDQIQCHDEKLLDVQNELLDAMLNSYSSSAVRDFAESYALVSGLLLPGSECQDG